MVGYCVELCGVFFGSVGECVFVYFLFFIVGGFEGFFKFLSVYKCFGGVVVLFDIGFCFVICVGSVEGWNGVSGILLVVGCVGLCFRYWWWLVVCV